MCGFKIRFSGFGRLVVAVCLVMMVASGAVAGVTEKTATVKSNAAKIDRVQEDLSAVKARVEEIRDKQNADSGRMWFERTKDKAESVEKDASDIKRWVESEKESSDNWSMGLTIFSVLFGVVAIVISVMTFLTARQQKIDAKEAKENLEKEFGKYQQHMEEFVNKKEIEINELAKKCDAMTKVCELKLSNIGKLEDEANKIVENISADSNNSNESQKDAVEKVRKNDPETTYLTLKAMALSHQYNKEWDKSLNIWKTLAQEFSNAAEPYFSLGFAYDTLSDNESNNDQKEKLLTLAQDNYEKATIRDDKHFAAWNNWGLLITGKCETATEEQKEALFNEAQDKYIKATEIDENNFGAWSNWGILITGKYKNATEEQKEALFSEAQEKYENATEIDENYSAAWSNWGNLISYKYKNAAEEQKEALFNEAQDKYIKATEINENYSEAWNNWGILIKSKYDTATEEQKEALFIQAQAKYEKAIDTNENNSTAWNNWGRLLLTKAINNPDKIDKSLLEKSKEKWLKAESIKTGSGAYNLAWLASLQEDFPTYKQWFEDFLEEVRREEQEAKGNDHQNTESEPDQE